MARGACVPSHSSRPAPSAHGSITLESDTVYILRADVVGFSCALRAQIRFMKRMGLPEEQLEVSEVGTSDMPVPTVLRGSSNPLAGACKVSQRNTQGQRRVHPSKQVDPVSQATFGGLSSLHSRQQPGGHVHVLPFSPRWH